MRLVPALLIVLVAAPMPAMAMTGAEFLTAEPKFAAGFAWGALEATSVPLNDAEIQREALSKCLRASSITSGSFFQAVQARIKNNPKALSAPASFSVMQVALEMCE